MNAPEERHANADLIAAAPTMYLALKVMADTRVDERTDLAQLVALFIAMAQIEVGKAEGRKE